MRGNITPFKEELEEMKRDAGYMVSTADNLYCGAQICLQGHISEFRGLFREGRALYEVRGGMHRRMRALQGRN
jgi:hypothetical protein